MDTPQKQSSRTFLVVVDDTEERRAALRYACKRAQKTGGLVALLRVITLPEFQHWVGVGQIMAAEAREAAEDLMQSLSAEVFRVSGKMPVLFLREGGWAEELIALINEEPSISILVLAAGTGADGPGPLVTALSGKLAGKLRIPVTIVPGNLTDEQIDVLT